MPFVTVQEGVRLHYRDAGDGPVLVFHPGFSNNLDLWNWLIRDLLQAHRCIAFDPRGHGDSDKPYSSYTLDELAGDVASLLDALNLEDVTLVGHSMGGAVALTAVLDHNDAGRITRLGLCGPVVPSFLTRDGHPAGTPPQSYPAAIDGIRNSWVETQLATTELYFYRTDIPATTRWLMEQTLKMPVYIAERYFGQLPAIDFRDRLDEPTMPVLVMWGKHDRLTDPRWLDYLSARGRKNWQCVLFENSGHGTMVEEPELMAALLADFCQR